MNIDEEFERFIEYPTEAKEFVTSASAKLFAQHCVRELKLEIEKLQDTIEDIQHCDYPQCKRVNGIGMSECDYCG